MCRGVHAWQRALPLLHSCVTARLTAAPRAQALGKPLIVEEFGKAHMASKILTDELPHPLQPGAAPPLPYATLPYLYDALARCHASVTLTDSHKPYRSGRRPPALALLGQVCPLLTE